jgi:hypothetical protein
MEALLAKEKMEMEAQLANEKKNIESGKMTMQSLLADLQKKLEAEFENSKVARDQKVEI